MPEQIARIRGIDPLLFRDGRPFADEVGALAAQTLALPTPGTCAGLLRTRWGNLQSKSKLNPSLDWQWKTDWVTAQQIVVAGPLLTLNDKLVFASPADAIVFNKELEGADAKPDENGNSQTECRVLALRPDEANRANCNLPEGVCPLRVTEDVKPASGYTYWTWEDTLRWLRHPAGEGFTVPKRISGPGREERTHVRIRADGTDADGKTILGGIAEEGKLFTTQSLSFAHYARWSAQQNEASSSDLKRHDLKCPDETTLCFDAEGCIAAEGRQEWGLLAKVGVSENLAGAAPFGGERRLALIEQATSECWQSCPSELQTELSQSRYVRLMLATPALFRNGWKPGWLNEQGEGMLPGLPDVRLRLVSAAIKRREPVSGWDYRLNEKNKPRGPKPVRWMVPAGSVYFFEVLAGGSKLAAQGWLIPVSDTPQDEQGTSPETNAPHNRNDGYGLALWGIWTQDSSTQQDTCIRDGDKGETL